jgi:hypothetical protein
MTEDDIALPDYAQPVRGLKKGEHPYLLLLPLAARSPALGRICADADRRHQLLEGARVRLASSKGFAYIDTEARQIVLSSRYYRTGTALDLYLDLLHELTHLRQLDEGADLWDERFAYVDRPTEIEGYAVAVEEGRRLGMSEARLRHHLSNPWMTAEDVARLMGHVDAFLAERPRAG